MLLVIKVFPTISRWFNSWRKSINAYEDLQKQVDKNTEDIQAINNKISRDYTRINQLQNLTVKQKKYIDESLEEREIILRSLLGIVQGLQEVGANGPTKVVEKEIQEYLVKKSHKTDQDLVDGIRNYE